MKIGAELENTFRITDTQIWEKERVGVGGQNTDRTRIGPRVQRLLKAVIRNGMRIKRILKKENKIGPEVRSNFHREMRTGEALEPPLDQVARRDPEQ